MEKPVLHLAKLSAEAIAALYKKLTGKEMTPEEMKYAEEKLGSPAPPGAH